ncbi:hypothetical protein ACOMHN_062402 [Nucella lapillus]
METRFVSKACGQAVPITNPDHEHLAVNATFSQPQASGAVCRWLVPAGNSTMSSQVVLTGAANLAALACDKNAFSVSEKNPADNTVNPLTLECLDKAVNPNLTHYKPLMGQPGFSLEVTLNTSSPLSENFLFMHVFPFVWTEDRCPRQERKIIMAVPGTKDNSQRLSPASSPMLSRYPDHLVCRWEFRAPDEGVVNLQLRTFGYNSDRSKSCGGGDHFMVSDLNNTSGPVIVPLCQNPGVFFDYTSMTGSVRVNMVSGSSGGAYQSFYFNYWSVPSCPVNALVISARVGEKHRLKGSSFSQQGAGREERCQWKIATRPNSVIKLYQLEAQDFQPGCDHNKNYLTVNARKVSICNSSQFPVWSENKTMDLTFQTSTELRRRSFLLRFAAVYKSPCQGFPERKTVEGSKYRGEYVRLMPIPHGDFRNGLVCQWIFSAKEEENPVRVSVKWAAPNASSAEKGEGVPFDKEACSFARFHAYDGETAISSAKITPTCSADKSTIIFTTSSSRRMLFVYRRESSGSDPGFPLEVNQVRATSGGAGVGKEAWFVLVWRTMVAGLFAVVVVVVAP